MSGSETDEGVPEDNGFAQNENQKLNTLSTKPLPHTNKKVI